MVGQLLNLFKLANRSNMGYAQLGIRIQAILESKTKGSKNVKHKPNKADKV